MRVLLDSHILLSLTKLSLDQDYPLQAKLLSMEGTIASVSVASLWEIAIKVRLGKLDLGMPLESYGRFVLNLGIDIIPIEPVHALATVDPEPGTKDPFDRMLLAQCGVNGLLLVTVDRALRGHPLAWKPASTAPR